MDGSTRSSHSNAFVSGFSTFRKVVIFDTLIEQQTHDEIIAVVNHELGHVHHSHLINDVVIEAVTLTVMFFFFALCLGNQDMLFSFGFTHSSNFLYLLVFS